MRTINVLLLCVGFVASAAADVKLPAVFSDGAVLQRESQAAIWGTARPGEKVTVTGSWNNQAVVATTADTGRWSMRLATTSAAGPHTLRIDGDNHIVLKDILLGEVWIASGQSNMEMTVAGAPGRLGGVINVDQELEKSADPQLQLFTVKRAISATPRTECEGAWAAATPETVGAFSATAYFFARELRRAMPDVPVGVISASWGGTVCESWTSRATIDTMVDFKSALEALDGVAATQPVITNPNGPTVLFNGMISPIVPFTMRGAIWYQGESNIGRAAQYQKLFPAMISDWRARWGQGEFPFYYVQIAPFGYRNDRGGAAELREAQLVSAKTPNTGMAITMDIGDTADIHPRNKQEVGRRLALWAQANTYGHKGVECSGPLYESMTVDGSEIRLKFAHGAGLRTRDGKPTTHCWVAGEDRRFVPAQSRIENDTLILQSVDVRKSVAARHAWGAADETNLVNGADLPASSFRTDDWPAASVSFVIDPQR
ncbi:MAG: hypothetical protein JNG88_12335 [Phycisphaerales bacterium]|nr:hypothetical protein [Phycisphaerales bacterium]